MSRTWHPALEVRSLAPAAQARWRRLADLRVVPQFVHVSMTSEFPLAGRPDGPASLPVLTLMGRAGRDPVAFARPLWPHPWASQAARPWQMRWAEGTVPPHLTHGRLVAPDAAEVVQVLGLVSEPVPSAQGPAWVEGLLLLLGPGMARDAVRAWARGPGPGCLARAIPDRALSEMPADVLARLLQALPRGERLALLGRRPRVSRAPSDPGVLPVPPT